MTESGYSGTPLWKKLGLNPGGALLTISAPEDFEVAPLPAGATVGVLGDYEPHGDPGELMLAFFASLGELAAAIPGLAERIFPDGALWVAWPRRAAGHDSDIHDQDIRDLALPLGLVDVKVAALAEDWSGLRLVWRKERRRA
jgi:Protein of unknown function (DUF3052)